MMHVNEDKSKQQEKNEKLRTFFKLTSSFTTVKQQPIKKSRVNLSGNRYNMQLRSS